MTKKALALLLVAAAWPLYASADDTLARFKGGIGVIPVSAGVVPPGTQPTTSEVVNRNFVRNVPPPGQIWVISGLDARVRVNGEIRVKGKGLILAGGNSVGRATGQRVFATLICEANSPFVEHSTDLTGVPLADNGDFEIDDMLSSPANSPLVDCASPMLLIRTAGGGAWFAAGIVSQGND
jgi:hypothetical protein